jgi:GH25 family lysozyme M1 (1,4-beta-N-acetylmuramidase)
MSEPWIVKVTDHSYWNDIRNWEALVELGVVAVVLRASSGATYQDPKFGPYYVAAKAAGLKVLAYHVSNPLFSAEANIANFNDAVAGYQLDGPPVLDCELTGGQAYSVVRSRVKDMFLLLKTYYGRVINYTRKYWWEPVMGWTEWVREFPLWVASYWESYAGRMWPAAQTYTTTVPAVYAGQKPFLWQFSDDGYFPEVSPGNMDKSVGYAAFQDVLSTEPPPEPVFPKVIGLCQVAVSTLNARLGPSTTYNLCGQVYRGTKLFFFERMLYADGNVWLRVGDNMWLASVYNGRALAPEV